MKRFIFFSIILSLIFSLRISAQVTVGTDEAAVRGALLQLKDQKKTTGGEANATKGLLLPRVWLTELSSLKDINPQSTDRPDPDLHIGLTVYNLNDDDCDYYNPIKKGVHIWDGRTWKSMQSTYNSIVETYKDQDGNEFRARAFGSAGTWMIENLRATKYANNLGGAPITEAVAGGITLKSAYTYPGLKKSNFESNPSIGLLYDWVAATNNKSFDLTNVEFVNRVEKSFHHNGIHLQGICPEGWHIPTIAEWVELEKEIIKNPSQYSSLENLTEPEDGLDPTDPFVGQIGLGEESILIYDRGDHGLAMTSICNPPGVTTENLSKGKTISDGGFSALMVGSVWGSSSESHNYGQEAYFLTCSLVDFTKAETPISGYVGVAIYPGSSNNIGVSTRTPLRSDNGGYLSVRCKKN